MADINEKDLIAAAVAHIAERAQHGLTEGTDMNRWLKETVEESREYHPMDVLQVASSLVHAAARRLQREEPTVAGKLLTVAAQIDRVADSY